jgi:hypothetical protein
MALRQVLLASCLAVAFGMPLHAQAVLPNHLHDRFQLSGSLNWVNFTTTIRVDSEDGPGTEIDLEDKLGASDNVIEPRLALRWNLSRRHSLELGYLFARRSGERSIEESFEYEGETFDAGLLVRTKFDSDLTTLTWRWALHSSEESRIGATLAVGALFFDMGLDGYLSVNDETASVSVGSELTAPLGAIGAFGHWRLGAAWYLEADLRAIYVPIDRYEAVVLDATAMARWFPIPRLGVEGGLGWDAVRVEINRDPGSGLGEDFAGRIRYRILQPRLGVVFSF